MSGGSKRNRRFAERFTDFGNTTEAARVLLTDAQTSGGLLIAVPSAQTESLVAALEGGAPAAAVVGELTVEAGRIRVI